MKPMNEMTAEERELYGKIACAISSKNCYEDSAYGQMKHVKWAYEELGRAIDRADGSDADWGAAATDAANLINQLTWFIKEAMNADHMGADYRSLRKHHAAEVEDIERELAK